MTTQEILAEVMADPAPKGWTLKALKHIASMSEETHCFSANLYIDGVKAASISNHGHGGPDMVDWTSAAAEKSALATVSGTQDLKEYGSDSVLSDDACFEITIGNMVNDALLLKDVKKSVKKGQFPIGVYAEDAPYSGFIFGLRSLDNLAKFLAEYKATRYRVFHL